MDYGIPAFIDNQNLIGHPNSNPIEWNKNLGLQALAESLQTQLNQVNQKLDQVLRILDAR